VWPAGEGEGSVEDVRASEDSVSYAGSEAPGVGDPGARRPAAHTSEDSSESVLEFLTPRSKPEGALDGEKDGSR